MRPLAALGAAICAAALALPSAASAEVRPGNVTRTDGGQCTSNFLFTDGTSKYLGQAAHCSAGGSTTNLNGCENEELAPIGTPVEIEGARHPGELAYSSWNAMQARGETNEDTCFGNDFALVRLHPEDAATANPTVPVFGGPTGLGTASSGSTVYSYQSSTLRGGSGPLSPKTGFVVTRTNGGWTYVVYTLTPGIPGDSGSGYMTSALRAFGVLSTVNLVPFPLSNGVADLGMALAYASASDFPVQLMTGSQQASRRRVLGLL